MLNYRLIHPTDAEAFLSLLSDIEHDSPYVLYKPGERKTTIAKQMEEIEEIRKAKNSQMWVVEEGDQLVGWLGAFGDKHKRTAHTAMIGLGVRSGYRNQGIGRRLFKILDLWAQMGPIRRLELIVHVANDPGIHLYEKMGFRIEGLKKGSYLIEGELTDEYLMGKLL
ncbi:MAG: GNAT family protein [Bacteroidota bacterium]